jgi:hypothetical protein
MSRQGIVVTGVEKGNSAGVSITGTARRVPPRILLLEKTENSGPVTSESPAFLNPSGEYWASTLPELSPSTG